MSFTIACVVAVSCQTGPRGEVTPGPGGVSSTDAASGDDEETLSGPKLDALGEEPSIPPPQCPAVMPGSGDGLADLDFTYVWIASSPLGTVSKIDTRTATEVARYYTSPMEGAGDPSRTAVNLVGDVAVTSRAGGVVKIAAAIDRCEDRDGDGEIETSSGPDDVLPFGRDECVRWYASLPGGGGPLPQNHQGPRPTAWDAGTADDPCSRLWVGWWHEDQNRGYFRRLHGGTGDVLDEVEVPSWDTSGTEKTWGPYGGAVDASGDFWVIGWGGPLVRIDAVTLDVTRWEVPAGTHPYGIALDADGHPWTAGQNGDVLHFDPDNESFSQLLVPGTVGGRTLRGLAIDREGRAFIAANFPCGLVAVDTKSMTLVSSEIALPDCDMPVGVGIDVDGRVWLPDQVAGVAFRYDPIDTTVQTVIGLVGPYTYSDMTGAGFDLVVHPPAG